MDRNNITSSCYYPKGEYKPMRNVGLLTFILSSEKRRDTLFLLLDRSMTVSELNDYFGVKAPEIIPRLRELESKNLIYKEGNKYHLTSFGKITAKKVRLLVNDLKVIDVNEKFFIEHDLSSIPRELLERINELGICSITESNADDASATHRILFDNISHSKSIIGVSPIFDKHYPQFFTSLAQKKIPVSIIITDHVFEIINKDYTEELRMFLSFDNARLYTIKEARIACIVTNTFTSFSLHNRSGEFDLLTNMMSYKPSAIKWGEELFEYYGEKSKKIDR